MRLAATAVGLALLSGSAALSACGPPTVADPAGGGRTVAVVAAESQYGDVAARVGGPYVRVTSVISNPGTDPHSYEVDPQVAAAVAGATVVVQNGLGYDPFMDRLEAAPSAPGRSVVVAARLVHPAGSRPNPHLWYDPATMPAVAAAVAADLARAVPAHAAYFRAAAARFDASLRPWRDALGALRSRYGGAPVATTEPVADYLLRAAGADIRTPPSFEAAVMDGVDPAPQDVTIEQDLLRTRAVRALVYNRQVTDSITEGLVRLARSAGVAVVGVYETMPRPGYDYLTWMQAETAALAAAVGSGRSAGPL